MTSTILISMMVFVGVSALIGLLAFVFREGPPKTATRLDMLIGKRRREDDDKADILRKTAFESDKKSLLEMLTPKFVSLGKMFEQADCHIKPNTLTTIGLLLAGAGMTVGWLAKVPWFFLPGAGLVMFALPWLWLWNKRRARLAKFACSCPTRWNWSPGHCGRATVSRPGCMWSARKCRPRSAMNSAEFSRNRTWVSRLRRRCGRCANACPTWTCASS